MNEEKYLAEIPKYQERAKRLVLLSVPFGLMTPALLIRSWLAGDFSCAISSDYGESNICKTIMVLDGVPLLFVWQGIYLLAEGQISRMKQAVRDYRNTAEKPLEPIRYTRMTKFINKTMPLFDNSPLPPEGY